MKTYGILQKKDINESHTISTQTANIILMNGTDIVRQFAPRNITPKGWRSSKKLVIDLSDIELIPITWINADCANDYFAISESDFNKLADSYDNVNKIKSYSCDYDDPRGTESRMIKY